MNPRVLPLRPQVSADREVPGRWLVRHRGHVYPFPPHARAIEAASDPAHLCRHACICPVLDRVAS